jgi:outer membrane lipoprotein-sorting protein
MRRLRSLSTRRLLATVAGVIALAASAAVAQAALTNESKPEPKPLNRAVLEAVNAKPVDGISARIAFTNALIPAGALPGNSSTPLLTGAKGRVWITRDGRFRLELQSEHGDAQIAAANGILTVYDVSADTVYRLDHRAERPEQPDNHEPATLADVDRALAELGRTWSLSGAEPTSTAGRPSYTVRIAPKDDGGLLGAGKLAWDAANGVPLRAAVFAQGDTKNPVLELEATDISYGRVDDDDLTITVPSGVKTVDVAPPAGGGAPGHDVSGAAAVQEQLPFRLAAPARLAGLPRREVRLVRFEDKPGALVVYGKGLGGMAVLERTAGRGGPLSETESQLPQINIDGATGTELATALGTVVTFERGGVQYTVVGSVPPAAAENAARGLR